jgi:hypothetical protein
MTEPTEDLYRMIKERNDGRIHRHINVQGDSVAILEIHCNNSTGLMGDIPAIGDFKLKSCERCSSADAAMTRAKQFYDESIAEGFVSLIKNDVSK